MGRLGYILVDWPFDKPTFWAHARITLYKDTFSTYAPHPRQELILLTAPHENLSIPICRFFCCLYSNLSGSVLRLPKMGAVLIFEWAFSFFTRTCILDDIIICIGV